MNTKKSAVICREWKLKHKRTAPTIQFMLCLSQIRKRYDSVMVENETRLFDNTQTIARCLFIDLSKSSSSECVFD